MNKYRYIFLLIVAVVLGACSKDGMGEWEKIEDLQIGVQPHLLRAAEKNITLPSTGSSASLSVQSIQTNWALENLSKEWLMATPEEGATSAQVMLKATENHSGYESRIAILSLKSTDNDYVFADEIAVTQKAGTPFAKPERDVLISGWKQQTFVLKVESNVKWNTSIPNECQWMTATNQGGQLVIDIDNNYGEERSSIVQIVDGQSDKVLCTLRVKQSDAGVSTNVTEVNFNVSGGTQAVVISSEASESDFQVESDESWLSCAIEKGENGKISLKITALPNQSTQSRSGYVHLLFGQQRHLSVLVHQDGVSFDVQGTLKVFDGDGTLTNQLKVKSNAEWKVMEQPEWLTVTPDAGDEGEHTLTLTVEQNASTSGRTGVLSIGLVDWDMKKSFKVEQLGRAANVDKLVMFDWEASVQTIHVNIPGPWQARISEPWMALSQMSGVGARELELSVENNNDEGERAGVVTLTSEGEQYEIEVVQKGQYLRIESSSNEIPVSGGDIIIDVVTSVGAKDSIVYAGPQNWIAVNRDVQNKYVLHVDQNPSVKQRKATFYVLPTRSTTTEACKSGVKLDIMQIERQLHVNVSELSFFKKGGLSEVYTVQADGEYGLRQEAEDDWYSVEHDAVSHTFSIHVSQNTTLTSRTGTLTFFLKNLPEGEILEKKITISQRYYNGVHPDVDDFDDEDENWDPKK